MAKLTTEQKEALARWADEGASLNEIQDRLRREFSLTMTYFDARMLLVELGVSIKQPIKEVTVPAAEVPMLSAAGAPADAVGGKVSLTVDAAPVQGAMVSGSVTFSDGKTAGWHLDQQGQLGLRPPVPGYKPPAADVPVFQEKLEMELQRAGF